MFHFDERMLHLIIQTATNKRKSLWVNSTRGYLNYPIYQEEFE
jgi:hypothetical protein